MSNADDQDSANLDEAQVADWLSRNPDFFADQDDLLLKLRVPHKLGGAVSLVERQILLLREGREDYRRRLQYLIQTARDNDKLFSRLRVLVLRLLESQDEDELITTLDDYLRDELQIPWCRCHRAETPDEAGQEMLQALCENLGANPEEAEAHLPELTPECLNALFGEDADGVKSAAILPVPSWRNPDQLLALLALGDEEPNRFASAHGTDFLNFLGQVLSRLLTRHDGQGAD